ncbi:MAG: hypothetical protein M5U09_28085 [Gammaproteobacteria bacterium]|nr:hypothetical protein [Gammaproteobacteria bacterium]
MPLQAQDLLPPLNPEGLPAPVWFLMFFKLVGFILHLWPMHLFFAGSLLAAIAWRRGAGPAAPRRRGSGECCRSRSPSA